MHSKHWFTVSILVILTMFVSAHAEEKPFHPIDGVVNAGIERGELPGAVVLVLHEGEVVFRKAYGKRTIQPVPTLMTEDTVFDLASLTKPIATALALMLLIEEGKLDVKDRLAKYLPAFARKETEAITLEHLLVHTSGFIPDNPIGDFKEGAERAWENLYALNPRTTPGSKFAYSDVGYLLLGKVVETVSRQSLEEFTRRRIFEPLAMKTTGFRPQGELKERSAPTEKRDGEWIKGVVHDPRAHLLGGVAGHAGLFSTADDLAILARVLLSEGKHARQSFLKAETVRFMTKARPVETAKGKGLRTYGWDMDTSYSSNRGERFPKGVSYGHTGFTGTSIWLDPESQMAVVFLSNRVHPDGKGNVTKLRGQVATAAAKAWVK